MIITEKVKIRINSKNIGHFKQFFDTIKNGDKIEIYTNQLKDTSHKIIKVRCDFCGTEMNKPYREYVSSVENGGKYSCTKCNHIKGKKTKKEKYDDENFNNREKFIKTCLEKYDCINVGQLEEVKNKIKETNQKNFNVDSSFQSDVVKEKIIQTNIKKYGTKHRLQNKECLENQKENNKTKYGYEFVSQIPDIKKKISKNIKKSKIKSLFKKYKNLINVDRKNNVLTFDCEKGHRYEINSDLFYNRKLINTTICTICNTIKEGSGQEKEILKFIKENYNEEILVNKRNIIKPYELDIYLPKLNLAFEFNGIHWHDENNKPNNYHQIKTELCEAKNIQLLQIWGDDWIYKNDIVKSIILNKIKKSCSIFARKCEIQEIDSITSKKFLENNHIQGFVNSPIRIGLFYNNEIVSLMTFGKKRKPMNSQSKDKQFELIRFCNKKYTHIVGGASRLFKFFIKKYQPIEITTYADRTLSQGNLYYQLGFNFISKTKPNYFYIINNIRKHRFNFRKDILVKQNFDSSKTEKEIMLERKIYRIYDAGHLKFIWTYRTNHFEFLP